MEVMVGAMVEVVEVMWEVMVEAMEAMLVLMLMLMLMLMAMVMVETMVGDIAMDMVEAIRIPIVNRLGFVLQPVATGFTFSHSLIFTARHIDTIGSRTGQ